MTFRRNRLPEPTSVKDGSTQLYLNSLLRELNFSFGNLTQEFTSLTEALTVTGDIEVPDSDSGLILTSPDGTRWRVQVDNLGILTTTSL